MFKKAIIATSIAVMLAGCGAEDRPYDTVEKSPKEISVRSLDTESLWMFMPSTTEAPRYAMTQRGFFQGDPKLVKLRFDENNGIYAEELDRDKVSVASDSRWDSEINRAPVLKIPGTFRQYRCAENGYGECTNREEVNNDANFDWKQATHFVPDYEDIKMLSQNSLTWFTASNVTETAEPKLVSYEYNPDEGVINIELERTFTAAPEDWRQFGTELSDLSFKTRFFYSLVKLDKLASKNYEPVYYQGLDSAFYGLFTNQKEVKTKTGESDVQGNKFAYLNRFNPDQESIDYYLSDSYFKPEVREYKTLTIDTINQVNKNLEGTGVPKIRIVNPNKKMGVKTGDLRYNIFNLIDEPVDNGLLGYGPSATNPLTGEIVHAHVNQYLGVILTATRSKWEELVRHYNRKEITKLEPVVSKSSRSVPIVAASSSEESDSSDLATREKTHFDKFAAMISENKSEVNVSEYDYIEANKIVKPLQPGRLATLDTGLDAQANSKDLAIQSFYKRKEMFKRFSEQNVYSLDAMWMSTQSKGLVKGIDYADEGFFTNDQQNALKTWDELSSRQQDIVTMAISKHMFKSTLIHELGHNLGLRHNFMGSTDKVNFYTQQELDTAACSSAVDIDNCKLEEAKKVNRDKPAAYSSIMDYGASIYDELLTFGKYDKAALRFAYAREVETTTPKKDKDGKDVLDSMGVVSKEYLSLKAFDDALAKNYNAYPTGIIPHLRQERRKQDAIPNFPDAKKTPKLADYRYCTDGHVHAQMLCNRFDEGTNLHELTQFNIQRYKDSYETMNMRNGREAFYTNNQYQYFIARWFQFQAIRDVIEILGDYDYHLADLIGLDLTNNQGVAIRDLSKVCTKFNWRTRKSEPIPYDKQQLKYRGICDAYNASIEAVNFFLEVMKTPDKICEVEEVIEKEGIANNYRFIKLSKLWERSQRGFAVERDIPATCFDKDIEQALASSKPNKMVIRSESKGGKYWSSLKANNPHQPFAASVDMLGIWQDKLLAAQMLVRRDSMFIPTERSNLALIDIDGKVTDVYAYISRLAGIPNPNTLAEKVRFIDRNGIEVSTVQEYKYDIADAIEATSAHLWPMRRFFGIGGDEVFTHWTDGADQDTRVPFFSALLKNIDKHTRLAEYGQSDTAQGLRDAIHISYANSSYDDGGDKAISYSRKGRKYVINGRNTIAEELAKHAMYTSEKQPRVAILNKNSGLVKPLFAPLLKAEGRYASKVKEARIVALRDADAIEGMKSSYTLLPSKRKNYVANNFVEYDVNGKKCLRFKKDGESDSERAARACNPRTRIDSVMSSLQNIDGDRLVKLTEYATTMGQHYKAAKDGGIIEEEYISRWTGKKGSRPRKVKANAEMAAAFDYPVEDLLSWLSNDYNEYRRVLEQLPVYK